MPKSGKTRKKRRGEGPKVAASKVYCLCREPYDGTEFMIACDGCEEWFHGRCIGISVKDAEHISSYYCAPCAKDNELLGGASSIDSDLDSVSDISSITDVTAIGINTSAVVDLIGCTSAPSSQEVEAEPNVTLSDPDSCGSDSELDDEATAAVTPVGSTLPADFDAAVRSAPGTPSPARLVQAIARKRFRTATGPQPGEGSSASRKAFAHMATADYSSSEEELEVQDNSSAASGTESEQESEDEVVSDEDGRLRVPTQGAVHNHPPGVPALLLQQQSQLASGMLASAALPHPSSPAKGEVKMRRRRRKQPLRSRDSDDEDDSELDLSDDDSATVRAWAATRATRRSSRSSDSSKRNSRSRKLSSMSASSTATRASYHHGLSDDGLRGEDDDVFTELDFQQMRGQSAALKKPRKGLAITSTLLPSLSDNEGDDAVHDESMYHVDIDMAGDDDICPVCDMECTCGSSSATPSATPPPAAAVVEVELVKPAKNALKKPISSARRNSHSANVPSSTATNGPPVPGADGDETMSDSSATAAQSHMQPKTNGRQRKTSAKSRSNKQRRRKVSLVLAPSIVHDNSATEDEGQSPGAAQPNHEDSPRLSLSLALSSDEEDEQLDLGSFEPSLSDVHFDHLPQPFSPAGSEFDLSLSVTSDATESGSDDDEDDDDAEEGRPGKLSANGHDDLDTMFWFNDTGRTSTSSATTLARPSPLNPQSFVEGVVLSSPVVVKSSRDAVQSSGTQATAVHRNGLTSPIVPRASNSSAPNAAINSNFLKTTLGALKELGFLNALKMKDASKEEPLDHRIAVPAATSQEGTRRIRKLSSQAAQAKLSQLASYLASSPHTFTAKESVTQQKSPSSTGITLDDILDTNLYSETEDSSATESEPDDDASAPPLSFNKLHTPRVAGGSRLAPDAVMDGGNHKRKRVSSTSSSSGRNAKAGSQRRPDKLPAAHGFRRRKVSHTLVSSNALKGHGHTERAMNMTLYDAAPQRHNGNSGLFDLPDLGVDLERAFLVEGDQPASYDIDVLLDDDMQEMDEIWLELDTNGGGGGRPQSMSNRMVMMDQLSPLFGFAEVVEM
ncbi:hypothetical protein RI367_005309 [Sorochytrium milnesiophthora]